MTRMFALVLVALIGAAQSSMNAQVGGAMPDAAQMSGIPLGAPELAAGEVSVRLVRERIGNDITDHPVTLTGGPTDLTVETDAEGRALFTGLPAGTRVVASAQVDGEDVRSQEFEVPASGGTRVALVAGIAAAAAREQAAAAEAAAAPARQGIVELGGETRLILEFQNDNLQVFQLLDIVNAARTPIDTGGPLIVELPTGANGATMLGGSSSLASVRGDHVVITGPFPPGVTQVQFGYAIEYSGAELTLTHTWPAAMPQVFAAIEKIGNLNMTSPRFTAQQEAQSGDTPFVMGTGGRLNAGEPLTIELTGLPYRSTTLRDTALALALLVILAGAWAAFTGAPARTGQADRLRARKEQLFDELVTLERQAAARPADAARYMARRQTLTQELERVMGELDSAVPPASGRDQAA